jgi:hypothetical protein
MDRCCIKPLAVMQHVYHFNLPVECADQAGVRLTWSGRPARRGSVSVRSIVEIKEGKSSKQMTHQHRLRTIEHAVTSIRRISRASRTNALASMRTTGCRRTRMVGADVHAHHATQDETGFPLIGLS